MQTNHSNSLFIFDVPMFFAEVTLEKHRSFLKIPPAFRVRHFTAKGTQMEAWLTLSGLPAKIWSCSLIPMGDEYMIVGGWKQFLKNICAGKSEVRLIFQLHSSTMTFVVTRFDGFGHLMRTPPDLADFTIPPSLDGLAQLKEEYVYEVGKHKWYRVDEQLVIFDGPFLTRLWQSGIPSSYTIQLETHRDLLWKVQVEVFGLSSLQFTGGWSRFALDTELNSSHSLKLRLLDGGYISAVIFHRRKGHLVSPGFSNANQATIIPVPSSIGSTSHSVLSHPGTSNSPGTPWPIATNYPAVGTVGVPEHAEPDVVGRVWQMQVNDHIMQDLQWYPACTIIVYDSFASLPQGFVQAENIALCKDVFLFQSLTGAAMLIKLVPHCNTLFMTEGYSAFKQHFQLPTESELSVRMVGKTHFVFNRPV